MKILAIAAIAILAAGCGEGGQWWVGDFNSERCVAPERTPANAREAAVQKFGYQLLDTPGVWDTNPWKNGKRLDVIWVSKGKVDGISFYRDKGECEADRQNARNGWLP